VTILIPEATTQMGKVGLLLIPTLADPTAPSLATDINGASTLDISCFTRAEGWAPSLDQPKGTAPRRVCTTRAQETLNVPTETLPPLTYVWNPQGDAGSDENKLYEAAVPGTLAYVLARYALPYDTAYAAAQFVNVHRIEFGERGEPIDLTDENAEFHITQGVINKVPVLRKVAIVA